MNHGREPRRLITAVIVLFILAAPLATSAGGKLSPPPLPSGHAACAGYAVEKRAFMLSRERVEASTCAVTARVEQSGDTVRLKASFRVDTLDSGDERRDEHVAKHLSEGGAKTARFTSQPLSVDDFVRWVGTKHPTPLRVRGTLEVAGRSVPMTFAITRNRRGLAGVAYTSFSDIGIDPPAVAGGMVAKVYDPLTIAFRVRLASVSVPDEPALLQAFGRGSHGGER